MESNSFVFVTWTCRENDFAKVSDISSCTISTFQAAHYLWPFIVLEHPAFMDVSLSFQSFSVFKETRDGQKRSCNVEEGTCKRSETFEPRRSNALERKAGKIYVLTSNYCVWRTNCVNFWGYFTIIKTSIHIHIWIFLSGSNFVE